MRKSSILVVVLAAAAAAATKPAAISVDEQAAISRISAESLRTNLSFVASDEREGRGTPSKGLDEAAEYIAARFRQAGLEPIGPDTGYFQTAHFYRVEPSDAKAELSVTAGSQYVQIPSDQFSIASDQALDFGARPVLRLPSTGALPDIAGKVVAGETKRFGNQAGRAELEAGKPAVIVLLGVTRIRQSTAPFLEDAERTRVPLVRIREADSAVFRTGVNPLLTLHSGAPKRADLTLRNVGGLLRGSDPEVSKQFVVVSAHYDHLGKTAEGIFPGANDNGSGTVSVIEIGNALAALPKRPRRSILFLTFFGEEEGLLGSEWYVRHPIAPVADTVADINLEQMGRTDDKEGQEIGSMAFTGPGFSNLQAMMADGAKAEGIGIGQRADADSFFDRSDNYPFAQAGVVAHTIAVAFEYPDYHRPSDTLDKIDFTNMAKVDRAVAAGVLALADATNVPKWNDSKNASRYRLAKQKQAPSASAKGPMLN